MYAPRIGVVFTRDPRDVSDPHNARTSRALGGPYMFKRNFPAIAAFVLGSMLTAGVAVADKQPKMHEALNSLQAAREALEKADADKGGHRAKALDLVKQAID